MIYLFDRDEKLIKIIRKNACKSVIQKQTLTDTNYVSDLLTAELKALPDDILEQSEYMAVPTKEDKRKFHLFFIVRDETEGNATVLSGVQSGIEELRKAVAENKRPRKRDAREVIKYLLKDTNWHARYVAETGKSSTNFYYDSVFDSLLKVCSAWQLEMQFFVEMNNNEIGARYIDFKKKIGVAEGRRVVYGHNALKILKQNEKAELITAVIGRGNGQEVSSAEENEGGKAGYGRKITFKDVVWTKPNNPLDKPAGQLYLELPEATEEYGINIKGKKVPKIGVVDIDSDDPEELLQRSYEYLVDHARPRAVFKTTSAYLKANIGDTVRVVRKDRNLDYEVRVFEITWDRLSNKAIDIKLGDRLNASDSLKKAQLQSHLTDSVSDTVFDTLGQFLKDELPSAGGFNTNFYSENEPDKSKVKIGDIWFKPDPEHEGHKIMLIWDGKNWVEVVRSYNSDIAKTAVEEAIKEIEKLKQHQQELDERNQKELDEFRATLKNLALPEEAIKKITETIKVDDIPSIKQSFDDLKNKVSETSETSRLNAEILGNNGKTHYNKNLLVGDPNRVKTYDQDYIELEANDGGFKRGETYTISFSQTCELLKKVAITLTQINNKGVKLVLTPTKAKMDAQTFEVAKDKQSIEVYPLSYTAVLTGDWYKSKQIDLNASEVQELALDMSYKEIADAKGATIIGKQSDKPKIILDGRRDR
ncbi:TPA: phage tail spike protein [Streptococcus pyogenes]|uniref:phage tail spike protein n=1 Tax=Streptococcus pyogenes TaxID=1314 RepID=UPI0009B59635|nr:phage tail spike protein [Streptococcus pyogenes]SQH47734.1 phage protein [Streptococcus pyogenes]VGT56625.1 phage protein [Streptococcus pyogenes]HEP1662010.1 phage tail protein [Streptococcus pyogenes]HEP1684743.1 phage tail protein [Streptococcus pyogenes]HEP1870639.1 phage tail protein [Streptococcus pyogenes]